jgi:hypothetical protein
MKRNLSLFFIFLKAFTAKIRNNFDKMVEAEPLQKNEAIDKFIYLLRRDFSITEQNEIILEVGKQLHDLRDKDIIEMEATLKTFIEQTSLLKTKILV